jgi:phage-related protein
VYYRDSDGREPVNRWLEGLLTTKPAAVAKIDEFVEEYLNGSRADSPPPEFPITSQIEGGLRELRIRFANTRYRVLYQRSGSLVVLLHAFEKKTGAIEAADKHIAQQRFADFKTRMDASPRERPRAAGHDAPARRGLERCPSRLTELTYFDKFSFDGAADTESSRAGCPEGDRDSRPAKPRLSKCPRRICPDSRASQDQSDCRPSAGATL